MRAGLRFEAVFAPRADVRGLFDGAAESRGWAVAPGEPLRYVRPRVEGATPLSLNLQLAEAWCTFTVDLTPPIVDTCGWEAIEDLLIGWCEAADAILGRSCGPDGFPRLEPWELTGAVDGVDAVQWLGPAMVARLEVGKRRMTIHETRAVGAALWLRVVAAPFDDPSEAAEHLADTLSLTQRRRPAAVLASIEASRLARAARAAVRTNDAEACAAAVRERLAPERRGVLDALLGAAAAAGVRERVARHLLSCLEHYGLPPIEEGVPVMSGAAPELLRSHPEDVVEAVARVLAWRPPAGRRLIESVVSLERWVADVENGADLLTFILRVDDPTVVDGMIQLDLADVRNCTCEQCANRRRRLAETASD